MQILEGELIVGGQFNTALSRTLTRREARPGEGAPGEIRQVLRRARRSTGWGTRGRARAPDPRLPAACSKTGSRAWPTKFERAEEPRPGRTSTATLRALVICARGRAGLRRALRRRGRAACRRRTRRLRAGASSPRSPRICRKVPWEPPETFPEALQALWFTHMLLMAAESYPGPGRLAGRVDQYLYPYYQADLDAGRLTREQAKELLRVLVDQAQLRLRLPGVGGHEPGHQRRLRPADHAGRHRRATASDASNDLT